MDELEKLINDFAAAMADNNEEATMQSFVGVILWFGRRLDDIAKALNTEG